jgi:cytochrome c
MMHRVLFAGFAVVLVSSPLPAQENNVARGQRDFRVCAPCHSLEPDRNMTGPRFCKPLEEEGRKLAEFDRYFGALKALA